MLIVKVKVQLTQNKEVSDDKSLKVWLILVNWFLMKTPNYDNGWNVSQRVLVSNFPEFFYALELFFLMFCKKRRQPRQNQLVFRLKSLSYARQYE